MRGAGQGVSIMQDKHQGNIPLIGSLIIIMNNVKIGVRKEIKRHDTAERRGVPKYPINTL